MNDTTKLFVQSQADILGLPPVQHIDRRNTNCVSVLHN